MLEVINISKLFITAQPQQFINWGVLLTTLSGAFTGAGFAFYLNSKKEEKKEVFKNLISLNSAIISLTNSLNILVNLKKDFILQRKEKVEEIKNQLNDIKNKIEKGEEISEPIDLDLGKLAEPVSVQNNKFEFDLNRIVFTVENEHKVLFYAEQAKKTINSLQDVVNNYNIFVNTFDVSGKEDTNPGKIERLLSHHECLQKSTDEALFIAEKAVKLLNQYGKVYLPKKDIASCKGFEKAEGIFPLSDYIKGWDYEIKEKTLIDKIKFFLKKGGK